MYYIEIGVAPGPLDRRRRIQPSTSTLLWTGDCTDATVWRIVKGVFVADIRTLVPGLVASLTGDDSMNQPQPGPVLMGTDSAPLAILGQGWVLDTANPGTCTHAAM